MKKDDLQKKANAIFKKFPKADTAYVSSDGFGFISRNAANLHKTTNRAKKDLKVVEFKNTGVKESSADNTIEFPITEKALKGIKLDKLKEIANALKLDFSEDVKKAELQVLINNAKNANLNRD